MGTDILLLLSFAELNLLRDFNLEYESLVDIVVIILLCIGLLVVIWTPLILLSCWTIYSIEYVKKFRPKFSVQKWFSGKSPLNLNDVTSVEWLRYRSTYSRMVGFGFSIFAYGTATATYLIQNFKRIENGLVEYFSFPFKVVKNMDQFQSIDRSENIDRFLFPFDEVWNEMIFIVVISSIFFLVGYIFAAFLVDYRLKKLKRDIQKTTKLAPKKEMFAIKVDRTID